jgi:hypothetical protein
MSISFGGFVLYTAAHFTSYLAADDYYNRMMTNMEAIFKNLAEASKLSFTSPDGDVTGTIDPRTQLVNYDSSLAEANDPQSDEMPEADDFSDEELEGDDLDPEDTDEPYEPYERIKTDYDPIRYE